MPSQWQLSQLLPPSSQSIILLSTEFQFLRGRLILYCIKEVAYQCYIKEWVFTQGGASLLGSENHLELLGMNPFYAA
jgi:hypothetical protein